MVSDAPACVTLSLTEVAARLGVTIHYLYRHGRELRDQHGFPPPLPGLRGRYDPLAIDTWIAKARGAAPALLEEPDNLVALQAEIDRRAEAMGRRMRA